MKAWVAAALFTLSLPALSQQAAPRIIGGHDATGDWPWAALVESTFKSSYSDCSGMLISSRWVITAAHCVYDEYNPPRTAASIKVGIGSAPIKPDDPTLPYSVARYYVPDGYNDFNDYKNGSDLALLELDSASNAQPLPSIADMAAFNDVASANVWDRDESLTAIGWGKTSNSRDSLSPTLQQVALDYVLFPACNRAWDGSLNQDSMLCAAERNPIGGRKQDTCSGDSGGPLFIGNNAAPYVIGLTSFGPATCAASQPSVYTRLLNAVPFIEQASATAAQRDGEPHLMLVDLAVTAPRERYYALPGRSINVPIKLTNASVSNPVTGASLSASASGLRISVSGSGCSGGGCSFANINAGQHKPVAVTASQILASDDMTYTLNLTARSDQSEYRIKNNTPGITLIYSDKADLTVSASLIGSDQSRDGKGRARFSVTVENLSTVQNASADDARLTLQLPAGASVSSVGNGVTCSDYCHIGALPRGGSKTFALTLSSSHPRTGTLVLTVDNAGSPGEFPGDNNKATVRFGYPAPPAAPSSGGGGGGSLGWLSVGLLVLAGRCRRGD